MRVLHQLAKYTNKCIIIMQVHEYVYNMNKEKYTNKCTMWLQGQGNETTATEQAESTRNLKPYTCEWATTSNTNRQEDA